MSAGVDDVVDGLVGQARERTGLTNLGSDSWRDGLTRLVTSVESYPNTQATGRAQVYGQYIEALAVRLRVLDHLAGHPEVMSERVQRPLVVLGLPRTGTTMASHLLDQDPARRSLLKWQADEPVPPATTENLRTDPRCLARKSTLAERLAELRSLGAAIPHWDDADDPTEDCFLQAHDFKSFLWESSMPTADYSEWYLGADVTSAYEYQRSILQILQSTAPGIWALKLPSHAVHIDTLLEVFPDARIVWAHRDPFRATASFLSINKLSRPPVAGPDFDPATVTPWVLRQLAAHVERPLRARERVGTGRFFDLHYDAVMRDPIGQMRDLYDWAGDTLTSATEDAMRKWLVDHPQNRFGPRPYSLDDFGVTRTDLEPLFDEYISAVNVELEDVPS
ncbi:sulfotransferase [Frankia sp. AgB1.9]|uniref:sulfotransferase family protein n=1 Tax=unclassified Frankia TaxID=2632575 RepID=UPI001931E3B5|nr:MULTISPECIES: sulfotransferase [unclassified Frankia]MBL7493537.1 sulfotransferase [Frankia sp. AgW1.1]MBL7551680.1 sulfotransferase [Frankia sp. AgB1.9]MBL7620216.1 sulfotransferase [Frankia sp. AgB1.8]